MPKWIAIRVSAALTLIGSVATLLFAGLMLWAGFFLPRPETGMEPQSIPLKGMMAGLAVFFTGFSVWGFLTGAGILRRREWARLSIIIFAVLLVGMGGSALIGILFIRIPPSGGVSPRMMIGIRVAIAAFYGSMAVIGAWWLLLFNSARAKQYFSQPGTEAEVEAQAHAEGSRPLSITIIAWFLLIGTLFCAVAAILRVPGVMFGAVLTGWAALAIYTAFTAVNLYLGTGLLQLQESARVASIVYFAIGGANSVVTAALPDFPGRMQAVENALPGFLRAGQAPIPIEAAWPFAVTGALLTLAPIWFLVRRRPAFATKP